MKTFNFSARFEVKLDDAAGLSAARGISLCSQSLEVFSDPTAQVSWSVVGQADNYQEFHSASRFLKWNWR